MKYCTWMCLSLAWRVKYSHISCTVQVRTVPVIKKLKYRTEAVPKQYRINTERRANLDSNVYMYAVRCGARGAVRAVQCPARSRYSASRRGAIRY